MYPVCIKSDIPDIRNFISCNILKANSKHILATECLSAKYISALIAVKHFLKHCVHASPFVMQLAGSEVSPIFVYSFNCTIICCNILFLIN